MVISMRARATVLISNYTYKYEGTIVMQTDDETQLKNLEKKPWIEA
jgi:hypothetical protein